MSNSDWIYITGALCGAIVALIIYIATQQDKKIEQMSATNLAANTNILELVKEMSNIQVSISDQFKDMASKIVSITKDIEIIEKNVQRIDNDLARMQINYYEVRKKETIN